MSNQYPPSGGGYPPPGGKTQTLGLDNNVAALLCYLPACLCCADLIFSILWLATEPKENRFLRFHALQGLLLFAVGLIISIIFWILRMATAVGGATMGDAGTMGAF